MYSKQLVIISLLTVPLLLTFNAFSQQADSVSVAVNQHDSLLVPVDSSAIDTVLFRAQGAEIDTVRKKEPFIEAPVYYESVDSMALVMDEQKVYLHGEGNIKYQDFELSSEYIVSNLNEKIVYAKGVTDSSGRYYGRPVFLQGEDEFTNDSLYYNIESGRGLIFNVKTAQGEGYLHSSLTKRTEEGHIHVSNGKYTTCSADDPHFYISLTKAIVIPEDKIISGPAYMVLADVPIPILVIPFGFFPNSPDRSGGLIIPSWGETKARGFYLKQGGWYQPIGQHADIKLVGDYYVKGSWSVTGGINYKLRYKFSGNTRFTRSVVKDNSTEGSETSKSFQWLWSHSQDPKANPTQSFSASVNFASSSFDRTNAYRFEDNLNTQTTSSISYTKNLQRIPFNLSLSVNASQNKQQSDVALSLPTGSFNMNSTVYPFRAKTGSGEYKWYENIGFKYNSKFAGKINTKDTLILLRETWDDYLGGFSHTIPFSISLKSKKLKMLTISPSLSYSGTLHNWHIKKSIESNLSSSVNVVTDTIKEIRYAHAINPGISVGLSPKTSVMYINTRENPNVIAVRHVIQPKASFSYVPDMTKFNPNYFETLEYYDDGELVTHKYSYFDNTMYGAPSFSGQSGTVNLGLGNNLEMKMSPKNDTTENPEPKKVVLIRDLSASASYRPFEEEKRWSTVTVRGSTQMFKNVLSLNISSKFDPYDMDSLGTRINEFYYKNHTGILRFTNFSITSGLKLRSKQGDKKDEDKEEEEDDQPVDIHEQYLEDEEFIPGMGTGEYVDFNIPWSLRLSYSYSLSRTGLKEKQSINHVINFNGDFSLTPKWKIAFRSGYDIVDKEVAYTSISINRDLHCWNMSFSVVPFGRGRSYNFVIRAKSSLLRDLKWDKKQSWIDNFNE